MYCNNIIETIGNTPLVKLNNFLTENSKVNLFGKLEWLNPGGSIKDRTAYGLIKKAEDDGLLRPGGTIVESTSGNLGIALAMIAAIKRYRFICVLDPKTPKSNINLMLSYGAEIVIVHETDELGGYQRPRIRKVEEIVAKGKNIINLDQYNNPASRTAHYDSTGPEIYIQLDGKVDILVGAVSTGGHLCGAAQYLKEKNPDIIVIGVEPFGSIIFGGKYAPYKQNGTGLSFKPGNYKSEFIDIEKKVSDKTAFLSAREIAKKEGILLGGSSGGVFHIALEYAKEHSRSNKEINIVMLFADGGTKYLDTIYCDKWMRDNNYI